MSSHPIAITTDGGAISLACWQGLPDDAESGEHIRFIDPGDRWDEISADVARHQAAHGCGDVTAGSTEDQDPLTIALAEVREQNEWRIRVQLFTEWTVENDVPEGDVRRLLAAFGRAMSWIPREERDRLAAMLRRATRPGTASEDEPRQHGDRAT